MNITYAEAERRAGTEKFWMVHGIGRGAPTVRHPSKDAAHKEAGRLALANPGTTYVVLKATKGYRADLPQLKQVDLVDPDFDWPVF